MGVAPEMGFVQPSAGSVLYQHRGQDLGVSSGSSACSEQQYRGSVKDREELENEIVRRLSQHRPTPMESRACLVPPASH